MSIRLSQAPRTSDGREIVQSSRFRGDVDPYICGAGDDRAQGSGAGPAFETGWASDPGQAEYDTVAWYFNDWIYISAGGVQWSGGERGDSIDMWADAPGSVHAANGGGTGNANAVDIGGGALMFTPAAGDGDTDLDLTSYDVVPVPAFDANGEPNGWWDWENPDTGPGAITANIGQGGSYNLYDFDAKLVHWVCALPMLGTGAILLDPQTKARKMLPHWRFSVRVHNSGHASFDVVWWLNAARKKTT